MVSALTLSAVDLARLEALQRTLLAPLEQRSVDKWRAAVSRRSRALFDGSATVFALPPGADRSLCYSDDFSPAARAAFEANYFNDAGRARIRAIGLEVFNQTSIVAGDWAGYHRDPSVNEFLKPNQLLDVVGLLTEWPPAEHAFGCLMVYRDRYGTDLMGDKGLQLLQLIRPAFRAGMRAVLHLSEHRQALARLLDTVGVGLQLRSPDGRVHYETLALGRLFAADPDPVRIRVAITRVAGAAAALLSPRTAAKAHAVAPGEPVEREVRTPGGHYRVHATLLPASVLTPDGSILITVEAAHPAAVATDAALSARFGLTLRECQVARLLAARRTTAEIADGLGVRKHTVRRHTERVFEKLGVHARGQVAAAICAE